MEFFVFMGFVSIKLKDTKLKFFGVYVWPLQNECLCMYVCHTFRVYLCSTPIFFFCLRWKIFQLTVSKAP